jgi:O-antigen/teichoic acid export membrane protein
LQGLLTLPAIVTAHSVGMREGGLVAFSLSVLALAMTPFTPISVLMLPHSVTLFQRSQSSVLRTYIRKVLLIGLGITGTAVIVLAFGARLFIRLYLGNDFANAAPMLQIISIAMFPYCIYTCLRSVIDAATPRAINSRNCVISVIFFSVPAYVALEFQLGTIFLLGCFVASMALLGALSFKSCRQLLREADPRWFGLA